MQKGVHLPPDESVPFGAGKAYSDSSVKWPRRKALATEGFGRVKRRPQSIFAETSATTLRQEEANMEMHAMLSAARRRPEEGRLLLGMDL